MHKEHGLKAERTPCGVTRGVEKWRFNCFFVPSESKTRFFPAFFEVFCLRSQNSLAIVPSDSIFRGFTGGIRDGLEDIEVCETFRRRY